MAASGWGEVMGLHLFSTETWSDIVFHGPDRMSGDEGILCACALIHFMLAGFWFEGQ